MLESSELEQVEPLVAVPVSVLEVGALEPHVLHARVQVYKSQVYRMKRGTFKYLTPIVFGGSLYIIEQIRSNFI